MAIYPGIEKALNDGLELIISSSFFNLRRVELYWPKIKRKEVYGEGYTLSKALEAASESYLNRKSPLLMPFLLYMQEIRNPEDYIDSMLLNHSRITCKKEEVFVLLETTISNKTGISVTGSSFSDSYNKLNNTIQMLYIFA